MKGEIFVTQSTAPRNYQETLLKNLIRENTSVTIYLTSGFQLKGNIRAFDNYVIVVESEGKQQMIYKHAISTIAPAKHVLNLSGGGEN